VVSQRPGGRGNRALARAAGRSRTVDPRIPSSAGRRSRLSPPRIC
jgi:hypothetical protein